MPAAWRPSSARSRARRPSSPTSTGSETRLSVQVGSCGPYRSEIKLSYLIDAFGGTRIDRYGTAIGRWWMMGVAHRAGRVPGWAQHLGRVSFLVGLLCGLTECGLRAREAEDDPGQERVVAL